MVGKLNESHDTMQSGPADSLFGQIPYPLTPSVIVLVIGGLSVLYLAYQWALPRPLPGIPYNKAATKTLLGDAAAIKQLKKEGGRPRAWFMMVAEKHKSPLVQIFLTPLGKPALILSDYREAQDILLRRSKEFDRSQRSCDILGGVIKSHHIAMRTSDPQFRKNRELVKDLMTPNFLNTVSGPGIYQSASKWVDLWRFKTRTARGRPFLADEDIHGMAFDIIMVAAFGEGGWENMTDKYFDMLRLMRFDNEDHEREALSSSLMDKAFPFPENRPSEDLQAHQTQQDALGIAFTQPFPRFFHKINNLSQPMRQAYAIKDTMLRRQVALGVERLESGREVASALDFMIRREINAAKKAGRPPVLNSPNLLDEMYGYLGAGHDTSSTTLQWAFKHLAVEQSVQQKLRNALRAAYPVAAAAGRQPVVSEMMATQQIPYLDAVIEEVLRLSGPVSTLVREATVDTTVLGHPVPKGTQIFFNIKGPSITTPGFAVDESTRSEGAKSHKNTVRESWDGCDCDPCAFVPERWLTTDENGKQIFDAQAGPFLSFGTGIRGCFGRRLAYLEMRIVLTLLIWNFGLGPLPDDLNSWECIDSLTTKPAKCYVRLSEI